MIKGIAITTILLLTVGIIVSGLVIYQVYRTITGSALNEHECRTRMISWCTSCMNVDWGRIAPGPTMYGELIQCASDHWDIINNDCNDQAEDDCSGFIPIWDGGDGGTPTTTTTTLAPTTCAGAGGWRCTSQVWCGILGRICMCLNCYDCTTDPDTCCCPYA